MYDQGKCITEYVPMMNTAAPMKMPPKILPELTATNSIRYARDPAISVPIPLFNPLRNVAPAIIYS